ncbi:MAG: ATP-binding protein [Candidatus Mcinerneyibacterium aminivorans]|uniref:ATP-binding protein n=1 Tax=Candidatus Mcinerneyibacterium aminivorans TaxID=2703815 RepID=A0A5D0MF34_9BACT|nr:MAG: ATP-binding protein [Candidatus Mcinerneyibacterium aminivorans]
MSSNKLKLEIPSRCIYLKLVETAFWRYVKINNLEGQIDSDYIVLALVEGVVNAIKHGNKNDIKKKVGVSLILEKNIFKIIIEDRGTGFNPDMIIDPTLEENLSNKNGRGIFIMKELMDNISYIFEGNRTTLIMEKEINISRGV